MDSIKKDTMRMDQNENTLDIQRTIRWIVEGCQKELLVDKAFAGAASLTIANAFKVLGNPM